MKLSRVEPGQYLDGRPPDKTRLLLEELLVRPTGGCSPCSLWVLTPQYSDGDTTVKKAPSFGWDVKPRSWLSVVIKNPMALLVKSRGVTPVSWLKFPPLALVYHGHPIIPIPLIGSILTLSSPLVAGVWWAHWHRCPVAAVASSKWMLHIGGGWGEIPPIWL